MTRVHAFVISVLLGAIAVMGGFATIHTVHIGVAATRPEVATEAAIKARKARLDKWEASLDKALRSRPPALPPIPHYDPVQTVSALGPAALPRVNRTVAPKRTVASSKTVRAASPAILTVRLEPRTRVDPSASDIRKSDGPAPKTPTVAAAPAPAPVPAPAPTPTSSSTSSPTSWDRSVSDDHGTDR